MKQMKKLFAQSLDVIGLVCYIRNVDVDEVQPDFVEFGFNVFPNGLQKPFTVLVDLLDGKRSDRQTELTENDLFGHLFDRAVFKVKQPLRRVVHDRFVAAYPDRERAGHIDTDVLHRESVLQRDVYRHGRETQKTAVLEQWPYEHTAPVYAPGRLAFANLAVDHENSVRRASFVARSQKDHGRAHQHDKSHDGYEQEFCLSHFNLLS